MINEMIKDGAYDVRDAEIIQKSHLHLFRLEEITAMLKTTGFVADVFRKEGSPWNAVVATK
jgi:hypothetical protein